MGKLHQLWQGLTYDAGKFSTKRAAYVVGLVVASNIVLTFDALTWDVLAVYLAYCSGPTSFRDFLSFKAGPKP